MHDPAAKDAWAARTVEDGVTRRRALTTVWASALVGLRAGSMLYLPPREWKTARLAGGAMRDSWSRSSTWPASCAPSFSVKE